MCYDQYGDHLWNPMNTTFSYILYSWHKDQHKEKPPANRTSNMVFLPICSWHRFLASSPGATHLIMMTVRNFLSPAIQHQTLFKSKPVTNFSGHLFVNSWKCFIAEGKACSHLSNDFKIGERIDSMSVNETKLVACHALLWRRPLQILRTFGRTPQRTSGYRHTSPKNRWLCDFSRKD